MAKKETTKKTTSKKKVTTKKEEIKVEELEQAAAAPIEEPVEEPVPIEEPETPEPLEVMNGDPAVLTDPVTEDGAVAEPLREKQEPTTNDEFRQKFEEKIKSQRTKIKLDRSFGLRWNGQEIDY